MIGFDPFLAPDAEIQAMKYPVTSTTTIVNCPVVPAGSTAAKRGGSESAALTTGWYKEQVVSYFNFSEKEIVASGGKVPTSPIYVCFNIDADQSGGGPGSGFKTESGSTQTHNVLATVPSNATYAPLWVVNAYSNTKFNDVSNAATALTAGTTNLGATVNCPVVSIQ